MNNQLLKNSIKFIGLILAQVLICNHINFLGYINPYIYIIFIILYPINNNRPLFIFLSFLLGLTIDIFSDSGGVNAAAAVTLAYARPLLLKLSFRILYDHQTVKLGNAEMGSLIKYISFSVIVHHLIIFSLEIFNSSKILLILKNTLFSSVFTIILSVLLIVLFSRNKK